jgi:hypothetical protein
LVFDIVNGIEVTFLPKAIDEAEDPNSCPEQGRYRQQRPEGCQHAYPKFFPSTQTGLLAVGSKALFRPPMCAGERTFLNMRACFKGAKLD